MSGKSDEAPNVSTDDLEPSGPVIDARRDNWVDLHAPSFVQPYLRLMRADRPIGFWLLFWPCAWSLTLVSMERGDGWLNLWFLKALALFLIGAIVMRGAGCVWNDITDRHIDKKVARTKSRPLPSGQVSVRQAVAFMGALGLIGLLVLLQFNWFSVLLGLSSLAIIAVYPFMKRFTNWPQAVLGLAFGWGALMGAAVRLGNIELPFFLIYLATICWIIGYDTIYAHQDREDDALLGLKSTALKFADQTKNWLGLFFGLTILLLFAAILQAGGANSLFMQNYALLPIAVMYLGMGVAAGLLLWQVLTLDVDDPDNCLDRFRHAHLFGLTIFLTLVVMWLAQNHALGRTYWTNWF